MSHRTEGLDFGVIEVSAAQNGVSLTLAIQNSVPLSKVVLDGVRVVSTLRKTTPSVFVFKFLSPELESRG